MPNNYIYSRLAASDVSKIYQDTANERGIAQADKGSRRNVLHLWLLLINLAIAIRARREEGE